MFGNSTTTPIETFDSYESFDDFLSPETLETITRPFLPEKNVKKIRIKCDTISKEREHGVAVFRLFGRRRPCPYRSVHAMRTVPTYVVRPTVQGMLSPV